MVALPHDHRQTAAWPLLDKGRYVARMASTRADLAAAQTLRYHCFVERGGAKAAGGHGADDGREGDAYDPLCNHVLVLDRNTGELACCFRLFSLANGAEINNSYAAQFYDLERLNHFPDPMIEVGRFCISPAAADRDVLRVAWGALARVVQDRGAKLLFGCTSFAGVDPVRARAAFALLRDSHPAPARWCPQIKAPEVVAFDTCGSLGDRTAALRAMPSLLRSYLSMGGWVSDHAVIDRVMNTMHVFTGLEIDAVPPKRAAALRALALT